MNGFVVFTNQSYDYISTHTPAGDERWIPDSSKNHRELQSTPPYGDECDIIEFNKTIFTISTHIPAWG